MLKPLLGLDLIVLPDGSYVEPYNRYQLLYLIPMIFGSLYYFILSKRYSWLAQLVIGFSLGCAGGAAFKGVLNELLPQLEDSFRPLYVAGSPQASISNAVFMITLISAISYFFFTFRAGEKGPVRASASLGRWLMMGCFGAFFGTTIMARMALLVERLDFLINSWAPAIFHG